MYSGKTLAHTGLALAGVTVAGIVVPWLAIGAAGFVIGGALLLRFHRKLSRR